jgi:hypothetical protein
MATTGNFDVISDKFNIESAIKKFFLKKKKIIALTTCNIFTTASNKNILT